MNNSLPPLNPDIRAKLYDGEDTYFKANPHVAGMAAEDNRVILNPYSTNSSEEQSAVAKNEQLRIFMRNMDERPEFNVTQAQHDSFKGTAYENDPQAMMETILARVATNDPSAGAPTHHQIELSNSILNSARDTPQSWRPVLQGLPNAELSSEVYPYIENSPVTRLGFDPARTTILPDTLGYRSKSNPDMVNYLNGRYIQPDFPSSQLEAPIAKTLFDYKRSNKDALISFSHNGNRPREDILSTISHESHHRGTSILDDQHYEEGKARLNDYYNGSPDSKSRAVQWFADRNVGTPEAARKKYKYDDLLAKASAILNDRANPPDPEPPANKDRILSFLNSF